MKRKLIFCTFALATTLFSGCAQSPPQGTGNVSTDTGDTTTMISEDEAKKIALDKVSGATVTDIRDFETDYANGKLQYEGKIYYGPKEYEFEIDGYDGTILEWDVEPIYDSAS